MADDTGKIQKGAMDAAVQAFKLEKERVSQQRIALENQKEVTKQTKELSQETEGIQGKFASLVDNLSKVNASMAIAAARQKQSNKGTFESIITMRQVNKVTKDLEKDDIFHPEALNIIADELKGGQLESPALVWNIIMYVLWRREWILDGLEE